jgi:hypothetical protein
MPWRPIGLLDVEAPTFFLDNRLTDGGKVILRNNCIILIDIPHFAGHRGLLLGILKENCCP